MDLNEACHENVHGAVQDLLQQTLRAGSIFSGTDFAMHALRRVFSAVMGMRMTREMLEHAMAIEW
eukprot:14557823-Alexandrium_andersonii.AAC.1